MTQKVRNLFYSFWIKSSLDLGIRLQLFSRLKFGEKRSNILVYLKTHSCLLAVVLNGIWRSEASVCLWGEALSRDWTRCFSRISRILSLELDADNLFSSSAFLEASSAASLIAMASSLSSCKYDWLCLIF